VPGEALVTAAAVTVAVLIVTIRTAVVPGVADRAILSVAGDLLPVVAGIVGLSVGFDDAAVAIHDATVGKVALYGVGQPILVRDVAFDRDAGDQRSGPDD